MIINMDGAYINTDHIVEICKRDVDKYDIVMSNGSIYSTGIQGIWWVQSEANRGK